MNIPPVLIHKFKNCKSRRFSSACALRRLRCLTCLPPAATFGWRYVRLLKMHIPAPCGTQEPCLVPGGRAMLYVKPEPPKRVSPPALCHSSGASGCHGGCLFCLAPHLDRAAEQHPTTDGMGVVLQYWIMCATRESPDRPLLFLQCSAWSGGQGGISGQTCLSCRMVAANSAMCSALCSSSGTFP